MSNSRFCEVTGKICHNTTQEAKDHLVKIKKINSKYVGNTFVCEHCNYFHVGRLRKKREKKISIKKYYNRRRNEYSNKLNIRRFDYNIGG